MGSGQADRGSSKMVINERNLSVFTIHTGFRNPDEL